MLNDVQYKAAEGQGHAEQSHSRFHHEAIIDIAIIWCTPAKSTEILSDHQTHQVNLSPMYPQ